MIQCPYSEIELRIAGMSRTLSDKLENSEFQEKFKQINDSWQDNSTENIAKFHSLTPQELTSSPNYQLLCEQYNQKSCDKLIAALKDVGLDDKEAWCVVSMVAGILK